MAIKIVVSQHVKFAVKGKTTDAEGSAVDFDFTLTAKRLDQAALDKLRADLVVASAKAGNHSEVAVRMVEIVTAWDKVQDADGEPLPFNADNLAALFAAYPGLALHAWRTYQDEAGVKEKN
jgi:hypothetical protein